MKLNSLHDLMIDQLADAYDAEEQIVVALPKMIRAASSPELRQAFEEHLEVTKNQVQRLDQIFDRLDEEPPSKKCKGIKGLLEEGDELVGAKGDAAVVDAGLIAAAQRVEHYEIATYGCARTYAEMLGHDEVANLLQQTLDEEGEADKKLTELAKSIVNVEAAEA